MTVSALRDKTSSVCPEVLIPSAPIKYQEIASEMISQFHHTVIAKDIILRQSVVYKGRLLSCLAKQQCNNAQKLHSDSEDVDHMSLEQSS
jgi:hypothetical protein